MTYGQNKSVDARLGVDSRRGDAGFTLVEILISIVLVGILSATVVLGIGQLTGKASAASCAASADAARTASNVFFVSNNKYPATIADMSTSVAGADPLMVVPAGATVSGVQLTVSDWVLTMTPGFPPKFACSVGGSTTTVVSATTTSTTSVATTTTSAATTTTSAATTTIAATTTTTPVTTTTTPATTTTLATTTTTAGALTAKTANGVTVTPSIAGDQRWYGEDFLTLTNKAAISSISITIAVKQTTGLTAFGQYTDFWSNTINGSNATAGGVITFTFAHTGRTIVPGTWKIDAQTQGTGTVHPTSGDTWSVTFTSQGSTATLSGTF